MVQGMGCDENPRLIAVCVLLLWQHAPILFHGERAMECESEPLRKKC